MGAYCYCGDCGSLEPVQRWCNKCGSDVYTFDTHKELMEFRKESFDRDIAELQAKRDEMDI